ncbi:hypothetical protein ACHAW5_002455 [Stephanodiscus triporus]|uniref:KIF-binding protein n=1 Tax=Stephanodiscus triporus TaxID=2934178 RepID=A0ABD3Q4W6_9STRA
MAANEEDMLEGVLLRDGHDDKCGKNDEGNCYYSILAPLLKRCYSHRNEIRKNMHNLELLREMQDVCSDFDDSAKRWDDRLQCLIGIRNDEIANGLLDETSDRAYNVRENFREANMLLGIDSIEVYEFFSRLKKERPMEQRRFASNPLSFTDDSLSNACHSFLMFAQETFRTALNLVLEHERCQATSSPVATIDNLWEKGQHFLLRGRAHYNIGLTMYELARSGAATERRQVQHRGGGQVESSTPLLMKARDEFDKAVERAKSVRHNTLLIRRHPNAKDTSSQSIYSWTTEAIMQLLEAIKLEMLASESYIASSWKLGKTEAVKERFDGVFESVEVSDVMNFANTKGVSLLEVAEVVCDMYWLSMRVAALFTEHLESLSVGKDWDLSTGEGFFQIALKAMDRVRMISSQVLKFDEHHSLDYAKERDIAKANIILQEENEIRKWWETTKMQASKRLSSSGCEATVFPRGDVFGELGVSSSSEVVDPRITRRIIVQSDDRLFQNRSKSYRTTRVKNKDSSGDGDIGERFSSEFCPSNEGAANAMGTPSSSMGRAMHTQTVFRKWGNEVLEEHERRRCCPALPDNFADMGISIDVIRALEKKLGLVLPAKN